MEEFEEMYGIPQIVGGIDGCHVEINAPSQNHKDYFNRKQHYSVNLQAIVDANLNSSMLRSGTLVVYMMLEFLG